jgi:hypothetical protein
LTTVLSFLQPQGDSSPLLVRAYLSTSYLTGAALLAKKAYAIENDRDVLKRGFGMVERDEHHACASAAIVMSVLGVEAFVNELFADCEVAGGGNLFGLTALQAGKLAKVWREPPQTKSRRGGQFRRNDFESRPSLEKYAEVLSKLELRELGFKSKPVKAMRTLTTLRNALAHYRLATNTVRPQHEQRARDQLEKDLKQYFPDHDQIDHNPMTGLNNGYFPDRVIGHAVAEWSVRTAVAFLEHFRERLSVTPQTGHRWPTQVMLTTR